MSKFSVMKTLIDVNQNVYSVTNEVKDRMGCESLELGRRIVAY